MKPDTDKIPASIPFYAHEAALARMERTQARLTAITIASSVLSALLILQQFRQRGTPS